VETFSGWSVIVRAQGRGPQARAAMGALIGRHERTVLTLIRQRGLPPDQTADDLKQAFFARMLEHNDVDRLDPARGHFRGWLKTAVRNFLCNDWERWYRKEGKLRGPLTDDDIAAAAPVYDPFDIVYAWDIYRPAFEELRENEKDMVQFEVLKRYLFGPELEVVAYEGVATALNQSRTRVATAVCRLRARQQAILRTMVAETLDVDESTPAGKQTIDAEVALICRIVSETPEPDRP